LSALKPCMTPSAQRANAVWKALSTRGDGKREAEVGEEGEEREETGGRRRARRCGRACRRASWAEARPRSEGRFDRNELYCGSETSCANEPRSTEGFRQSQGGMLTA
jgi:hypothetical protein